MNEREKGVTCRIEEGTVLAFNQHCTGGTCELDGCQGCDIGCNLFLLTD